MHVLDAAQLSTLYTQHVLPVIQEMLLETPPLPTLALRIIMPLLSVLPQVSRLPLHLPLYLPLYGFVFTTLMMNLAYNMYNITDT